MTPAIFEWDDENVEHISRHGIEAEAVFDNKPLVLRTQDEKYLSYGQTDEGRYLLVVFATKHRRIRVITARDLTESEKRRLRRRRQ